MLLKILLWVVRAILGFLLVLFLIMLFSPSSQLSLSVAIFLCFASLLLWALMLKMNARLQLQPAQQKARLRDYLPVIWVILGSFFVIFSMLGTIASLTGRTNDPLLQMLYIGLAGIALLGYGRKSKKKLTAGQHDPGRSVPAGNNRTS